MTSNKNHLVTAVLLLGAILFLCYSNTFNVPWVLDDPPNITQNLPIQIDNLWPETILHSFYAKPFQEGVLYRPIVMSTFAVNWYFGKSNPIGYHIVNLIIHIISSIVLYKTCLLLLKSSPFRDKFTSYDIFFIALLATILWAINPIQIQAITYIVQRMASMAAMFFLLAFYFFIAARRSTDRYQIRKRILLCLLFFLLALGCKENTITLIPSLLLVEVIFFYDSEGSKSDLYFKALLIANILLLTAGLYYLWSHSYFLNLFSQAGSRPFSPYERLLTQPAILLFYLSLLLFPFPSRFSIDHDFPLSISFFDPWTTLPSIIVILVLVSFGIIRWRKNPLLSFTILFFFINHMVESSIIPLELVFEHRNYLPSFFLFLPIAAFIKFALDKLSAIGFRVVYLFGIILVMAALTTTGYATYQRNSVWQSEENLWKNALSKAPGNARPYSKLGDIYGWQKEPTQKNTNIAVGLYQEALNKVSPRTSFKPAIVDNIGKIYMNRGMLDQAVHYFRKSNEMNPGYITARFDLAKALTMQGNFKEALDLMDNILTEKHYQNNFFNLRTLLLLWLDRPDEAVISANWALSLTSPNGKKQYYYNTGVAMTRAGHYSQGLWFLNQARYFIPDDFHILASSIENRLLAGDTIAAETFASQLVDRTSLGILHSKLTLLPAQFAAVPVNTALILPYIVEAASAKTAALQPIQ